MNTRRTKTEESQFLLGLTQEMREFARQRKLRPSIATFICPDCGKRHPVGEHINVGSAMLCVECAEWAFAVFVAP